MTTATPEKMCWTIADLEVFLENGLGRKAVLLFVAGVAIAFQ